ncbi:MAG: bifunctional homocysteine S-methyltransferase/methylenetetrahydrofolate reductase [Candidatus Riflebacteria bacterium HGW-Riflebacteria-1]|nr:MAG: bifunctional homocysteine S-methyltransferase/methylenetetrahydrofolate reductase [Candidatus Riflebacteria bacterium HGW-Riflebacteria-1]
MCPNLTTGEKQLQDFREFIEKNIVIFDGAMGTRLYEKGVYINRVYDELNLSQPALIQEVHREYLAAGAMVLETNSFGANRFKLEPHGLADKLEVINFQAAKLAREAAGDNAWVAGSIGPLGIRIEPWGKTSVEEAEEAFTEQARGLLAGGVDIFILETFFDINEIHQAIKAVRKLSDKPIIASMTINEDGNALYGTTVDVFTPKLESWGADVIGLNCSVGPKTMYDAIEKMRALTRLNLIAQPNAGLPRVVDGRMIYLCNPEYFGEYARRFFQLGVRMVGGCCGTTPEHIKWVANSAKALSPGGKGAILHQFRQVESVEEIVEVVPLSQKSALGKKLAENKFVVTAELTPPKGCDPEQVIRRAQQLKEAGIDAINIPDGPRASARLSPLAMSLLIEQKVGIETILHYCCRDRNILGIQSDLLGAYAIGLRNILAITGDPPKVGNYPQATAVFDIDAIGLVNVIHRLNHGRDLGNNAIGRPTGFVCGVGANPGAIDLDLEVSRFEWKVDAGAEYAITQPVFDVELLERFLERISHVRIPVFAGIWPLASLKNAEFMNNEVPGASVPEPLLQRMRKADTIEAQREEGILIAREALERVRKIVNGVQVSVPFGRVESVLKVIEVLG